MSLSSTNATVTVRYFASLRELLGIRPGQRTGDFIDMVLPRQQARSTLARILHFFGAAGLTAAPSAPATPEPAPTT